MIKDKNFSSEESQLNFRKELQIFNEFFIIITLNSFDTNKQHAKYLLREFHMKLKDLVNHSENKL